ncbi:MAG: major facilitator superfamily domain-containing protein [Benjaminiella poitrasii]|nr:MAG: major facilitator superfamily domain-containing protein [Benjaminiella poitrasii]
MDDKSKRISFNEVIENDAPPSLPQQQKRVSIIDWKFRSIILTSMLIIPVGCHYMEATLSTLKTTLKTTMAINNTQFSILMSSVTLVNTVLPLFAGAFADNFSSVGTMRGTLAVSLVIFIGSLLVTIGANYNKYAVMLTGQVIYGLGDGMIVTFQEAILSRWFRDRQLAIIVGIMLSVARLTKFIAKLVCYPIANYAGTFTRPITVAMVLCALSVLANILYWLTMVKLGFATLSGREKNQLSTEYHMNDKSVKKFEFRYSMLLYLPSIFWMVPWLQITMSSVLSSFDDVATEFVQFRYQTTEFKAGYISSLTQVVPIVAAPLLGIFVHRYGKRLHILFAGTIVLIISILLLAYTWVIPIVGMILISFALSLGPVSLMSSTSILLPAELVGIGVGLHKCGNNIGTTIIALIVGYVQDLTYHDGNPSDNMLDLRHDYDYVMIFYLFVSGVAVLLALLFWFLDRKYLRSWLQINRSERQKRLKAAQIFIENEGVHHTYISTDQQGNYQQEKAEENDALKLVGSRLRKTKSYFYFGLFLFWLLVAWVVFFVFALMPIYQSYDVK